MTIAGLIFDFDGTLANASSLDFNQINLGLCRMAAAWGLKWPAQGYVLERLQTLKCACQGHKTPVQIQEIIASMQAYIMNEEIAAAGQSRLWAFTPQVLAAAAAAGIKLAIVSRNCRPAILRVFPQADNYILIAREDTLKVKPDPAHFHQAARRMEVDIRACAVIGDHPMDMQGGKAAGCLTVGVLSGLGDEAGLRASGADLVMDNISYLLPALCRLGVARLRLSGMNAES
jgi:phosphoglycolate phosphatase